MEDQESVQLPDPNIQEDTKVQQCEDVQVKSDPERPGMKPAK